MIWLLASKEQWPLGSLTVCLALVAACTTEPKVGPVTEPTISDISADSVPAGSPLWPGDAREKAIEAYRKYLDSYPASPTRKEIKRRLADLLMASAADLLTATPSSRADSSHLSSAAMQGYGEAIAIYEELLQEYPDGPDSAELLYQLARAYEERGEPVRAMVVLDRVIEHSPDIDRRLYADAQFRRGESLFGEGSFQAAEHSYGELVRLGESTHVYEQALYKLGWSLFKQDRYDEALDVYFALLDRKIPFGADLRPHLATLSRAEQEQVADVFRAISLSFSYLSGVDSIVVYFSRSGTRTYEEQVYRNLAELYASKEFFTDAAKTYLALAQRDPVNPEAPRLYIEVIRLYQMAGLTQSVLETKAAFVRSYGMNASFWDQHDPQVFPNVVQYVQSALVDLARHHHARALDRQAKGDYREAERWCRTYLASFDGTERAASMNFRLARVLHDSGEYDQAVYEYERTAYSRGSHPLAAEAGRSALLAYEQYKKGLKAPEKGRWSRRSTASAIRFAEAFSLHPDAAVVLAQAGVDLLDRGESGEAIRVSETILQKQEPLPSALRQTAWSVLAQAHAEQGDYQIADNAYRQALELTEAGDPRRLALSEGMAATIYKHAAIRLAQGDRREAVAEFLRAANAAPDSPIRPKAQYDAAASLLALEEWREAAGMLEQFRAEHPEHRLQGKVTQKLAFAYHRGGRETDAAAEYLRLGRSQGDDELRREALLQAADLYERAGRVRDAVGVLELYVAQFSSPADQAIEVLQRLADLEQASGNNTRRRHWLRKIIVADRTAGHGRNAGTRSSAAHASLNLAEERLVSFQRIRLVEPLKDSLGRKLQEMKVALKALEKATEYGIAPVTTAATYKIANMYDELSRALRASQRPGSLGLTEMAQYDLLIEDQAAPLAQMAIEVYEANVLRIPDGQYDTWIEKSLNRLAQLWPIRYAREERSEADGALRQVPVTNPGNPIAYNELGIVHRRAGRFQQARDAYERALSLRPDYSAAHLNLGILCELYFQHRDCAMRQYEAYQRLSTVADPQVNLWIEDLRQRGKP